MKQFEVPEIYRSPLISAIKNKKRIEDRMKKDFSPTLLDFGAIQIYLARHFGFCYGVENAIEIAFRTVEEHADKNIYLLSEMIHNPQVNRDLQEKGIRFIQDTCGNQVIPFDDITGDDIVLIPAFGTTLEIESILKQKGIEIRKYNTTCPFVEKVWNRSAQIASKGYTIIVHGKPKHEETRATFSHASANTPTIVINDMKEAKSLALYMHKQKKLADFYEEFKGRYSVGFDVEKDLQRIGVVNQTTQLASETQAIADFFKDEMKKIHRVMNDDDVRFYFADTRDTLCYATNDNQHAVHVMLQTPADLAIVVGGYNSSNTSHLVEMCESKLPTYFIDSADKIISSSSIVHCNWKTKEVKTIHQYLPQKTPVKILMTSGASCPDAIVEQVIKRLLELRHCAHMFTVLQQYL